MSSHRFSTAHAPRCGAIHSAPESRLFRRLPLSLAAAALCAGAQPALAQSDTASPQEARSLSPVTIREGGYTPSVAQQKLLPNTTESVTARQADETINVTNSEDMVKYLPSLLVRKRFIGDTQEPIATRTTGINASARTLITADGVTLSTYIGNNNSGASPQWFMVAPEEVERIDVMYGPFAAEYPGNSYGAVVAMTTRMPEKFEASVKLGASDESFNLYGTHNNFGSTEASALLGNRQGALSWWFSLSHLDSSSQPITFGTLTPAGTVTGSTPVVNGGYNSTNRTGSPILVASGGAITHTLQDTVKLKLGLDLPDATKVAYTLGFWRNDASTAAQSYLSSGGSTYYGAGSGTVNIGGTGYSASSIASGFSSSLTAQDHLMQSLALKRQSGGPWDWEATLSNFRYLTDSVRSSTGFSSSAPNLYPSAQAGGTGRISDSSGTGWSTYDVKGIWRPGSVPGANTVSFGAHYDQYTLNNPTYNTANWISGANGSLYSESAGSTHTSALWAQDVWKINPRLTATLGARYENWHAYNGVNINTVNATATAAGSAFAVNQPAVSASGLSPKASLSWAANELWHVTGSIGRALRFPTVGELYQNVATGSTYTQPNPNLKPEDVLSSELSFERATAEDLLRITYFEEHVKNALISQSSILNSIVTSYTGNVDRTRQRGIELVAARDNFIWRGFDLSGSLTYVNARILADSGYVPSIAGASAVGSQTPYVPTWRSTVVATWRPDEHWSFTGAARYSSKMYATVDNTDTNGSTYTGFGSYLVVDARAHYKFDQHWDGALGIDNLNNNKYWLYHPFPQRTFVASLRWRF